MTSTLQFDEDDNIMAAEYVVGLLPLADRQAVTRRARQDADFAALIAIWENHLAGIDQEYGSIKAPAHIKTSLENRLFTKQARRGRAWFFGAIVASLLLVAMIGSWSVNTTGPELRADLRSSETTFAFSVEIGQGQQGAVQVTAGALPDERIFELWLVPPEGAPVSLGTFANGGALEPGILNLLSEGATLAVSLEPDGGSPTGAPTGPVLAVGVLEDV